jgi:hypothetical protein
MRLEENLIIAHAASLDNGRPVGECFEESKSRVMSAFDIEKAAENMDLGVTGAFCFTINSS